MTVAATARWERSLEVIRKAGFESETDLARSLVDGDAEAPSVAWNHYEPLVRKIVHRAFGYSPEVDDITQEVFLRLFMRVGTLRKPDALRSFVVSFALRIVKWERRRQRSRKWLILTDSGRITDDRLLARGLESRFDLRRLYNLLDKLSVRERNVLMLRHVEGMKLTEISEMLRISLATTKRTLKRASYNIAALNRDGSGRVRLRSIRAARGPARTVAAARPSRAPDATTTWARRTPSQTWEKQIPVVSEAQLVA